MKTYFETELTKIYHGGCLPVMDHLISLNTKAALICVDPDYEVTKKGSAGTTGGMMAKKEIFGGSMFVGEKQLDIKDWLPRLIKLMDDNTQFYIFTNDKNINYYMTTLIEHGLKIYKNLIWVKDNKIMGKYYMSQKEYIIFGRKKNDLIINDCGTSDVLTFPNKKGKDHQGQNYNDTEKPLELLEMIIENSTQKNDLVIDIMMGTGTTNLACERKGRRSIGIDIRQTQCERAKHRLQNMQMRLEI